MTDQTTAYALDVAAGKIIAGRPVRLACERHLRDLRDGHARGLFFDIAAAQFAIQFFTFLTLAEGQHDGKPFILQPFQCFIVGSLFGWKGADGYRRFRTGYIEIGKGNGKSPLAAGIGVKGLIADGEAGAEIYAAAVMRDQAKIVWSDADKMIQASEALRARVLRTVNNLAVVNTHSFFRPISSEGRGLDGKRVHIALIDEVHEHPNPTVVDKMRAGTKGAGSPSYLKSRTPATIARQSATTIMITRFACSSRPSRMILGSRTCARSTPARTAASPKDVRSRTTRVPTATTGATKRRG
jgi:phage terminase large subunit-like protein